MCDHNIIATKRKLTGIPSLIMQMSVKSAFIINSTYWANEGGDLISEEVLNSLAEQIKTIGDPFLCRHSAEAYFLEDFEVTY
jgi:hypothetical protein